MKFLKKYEYYYDQNGKIYSDDQFENLPDSFFHNNKLEYINELLEKHLPELKNIKARLIEINNDLENVGPLDENIQDTIDSLDTIFKKWENRPINRAAKKYNL
jgi:hypothetical protein